MLTFVNANASCSFIVEKQATVLSTLLPMPVSEQGVGWGPPGGNVRGLAVFWDTSLQHLV